METTGVHPEHTAKMQMENGCGAITKTMDTADTGRILVRESGTEPVVRIMAEAEDKKLCEDAISKMRSLMERKGMI